MTKLIKGSPDQPEETQGQTLLDQAPDLKDYAQAKRAAEESREKHTFKTPPKFKRGANDPKSITILELTLQEEDIAWKLSMGSDKGLADEMLKRSLYAVDGRVVNHGVNEAELYYARWSARFRKLAMQAFARVNNTDKSDDDAFLASEEISL